MGSGRQYDLHEIIQKSSSSQMKEHLESLQKFLDHGYTIEEQEEEEETGLHGEVLNTSVVTTLKSPMVQLPLLKFAAKEIFGTYDFGKEVFNKWDQPKFELKAYKKSADVRDFNAPWQPFDME
jgi:hypothetical protein